MTKCSSQPEIKHRILDLSHSHIHIGTLMVEAADQIIVAGTCSLLCAEVHVRLCCTYAVNPLKSPSPPSLCNSNTACRTKGFWVEWKHDALGAALTLGSLFPHKTLSPFPSCSLQTIKFIFKYSSSTSLFYSSPGETCS